MFGADDYIVLAELCLATRICMPYSHAIPCIDEPCLGLLGAEPQGVSR